VDRGLARGDLFPCKVPRRVTGEAGTDLLVPSDFVDSEELTADFSGGVVLFRRPTGLATEPVTDFRGPCGLFLVNVDGGVRSDVTGDPTVCGFGASFGEFEGSRPVSDFLLPRTGFGPPEDASGC